MNHTKITKQSWFKWVAIALAFIVLSILVSTTIIFTHPKPLHFYLELLNKNSHRNQDISVYTKEEFAIKYLGVQPGDYQPGRFTQLFEARFNNSIPKENNLFKVYQIVNKDSSCQVDIFGVSKKNNLVYVSFRNICNPNGRDNK